MVRPPLDMYPKTESHKEQYVLAMAASSHSTVSQREGGVCWRGLQYQQALHKELKQVCCVLESWTHK